MTIKQAESAMGDLAAFNRQLEQDHPDMPEMYRNEMLKFEVFKNTFNSIFGEPAPYTAAEHNQD